MIKKIIIFFIFLVLLSSFVIADPSFYYKRGDNIDLKIPCVNSGSQCSVNATCNITINNPNSNTIANNQLMTNNGAFHNYTLSDTTVVGEYQTTVFCTDGADSDYASFIFSITENGTEQNDWTFILAIAIVIGLLLVVSINITERNGIFIFAKVLLLVFSLLFALLIPAFFVIRNARSIFYSTFTGMISILSVFVIIWLIYWALKKYEVIV